MFDLTWHKVKEQSVTFEQMEKSEETLKVVANICTVHMDPHLFYLNSLVGISVVLMTSQ